MHQSVLLQEVIDILDIAKDDVVVDATFGGGGHSKAICELLGSQGMLISLDADLSLIERGHQFFKSPGCMVRLVNENFRILDKVLADIGLRKADKYLFDLGLSSIQLEEGERGFSFKRNEPLVMTFAVMRDEETLTAKRIVNEWSKEHLKTIISGYGEEKFALRIAEAIVKAREQAEITTTKQLADIIYHAVPIWYRRRRIHPATKTFQALRITVNDEIESLKIGLEKAYTHLNEGGRIAVISFHSIEDRIVKQKFKGWQKKGNGEMLTKKPITPSRKEIKENPRSRSAKLRLFKKYVTNNIK